MGKGAVSPKIIILLEYSFRSPQQYDELDFQQDDDVECSDYDDDENQQGQVLNKMFVLPPPAPKISTCKYVMPRKILATFLEVYTQTLLLIVHFITVQFGCFTLYNCRV